MLRTGLKFPVTGLNLHRVNKREFERIYLSTKCYSTKSKGKCDHRLLKDVTFSSRLSGPRYSTGSSRSEKGKGGTGLFISLGAVTIGAIGILAYAKSNSSFRVTLEDWIPGTDKAITIIFQEDGGLFEHTLDIFRSFKQSLLDLFTRGKDVEGCTKYEKCKNVPFTPPRPAFDLSTSLMPPPDRPKPEIRLSKEQGEKIVPVAKKPCPPEVEETSSEELHKLEKYAGELAKEAISAFNTAACAVQAYNKDVYNIVESSDSTVEDEIWNRLKTASETKLKSLQKAEKKADEVVETLRKVKASIDNENNATQGQKTIARRNISKILASVDEAKKSFDQEVAHGNISEKYWKKVKTAREKFTDEIKILFPNVNLHDKKLSINDEAFDIFVLHMYHKISFLQKELEKMQTVAESKLRNALRSGENEETIKEIIELEVEKEKRTIQENFDMKILEEKKEMDDEMRRQLKLQSQIHADHLQEVLATKERETERHIKRALSEKKEEESINTKAQLASVIGKLRGLDEALKNRLDAEKDATEAQLMWGACQALGRAVKAAPPGTSPANSVRPLSPEIKAIVKAAPKGDVFVNAAIEGIPEEAVKRGVFPEDALRERFIQVEKMARKLALVPEDGASLPVYLLSYLQSFLLVKAVSPIPKHELDDEPIDADALSTYDVLQRARYWLDRGDFKMTLRYMNLLKGAPRSVARDWMNEARILLETQQAIESLIAYAGAGSLVFMGGGEPKEKKK